jgi:hypothetical protein
MVEYIKKLGKEFLAYPGPDASVLHGSLFAFSEELDRLDPRDFVPAVQYEFVHERMQLRRMVQKADSAGRHGLLSNKSEAIQRICTRILGCLDGYGGENSRNVSRSFVFIGDADLRKIIERDYREFALVLLPGAAWKSSVVMAGSILEAILFDAMTNDPAVQTRAMGSSVAPTAKGAVKPLNDWTLQNLIDVAADINVIPPQRAKAIDQSLRDYRNYVHPKKEIRTGFPCTEAEAHLAQGALESVLNHLAPSTSSVP